MACRCSSILQDQLVVIFRHFFNRARWPPILNWSVVHEWIHTLAIYTRWRDTSNIKSHIVRVNPIKVFVHSQAVANFMSKYLEGKTLPPMMFCGNSSKNVRHGRIYAALPKASFFAFLSLLIYASFTPNMNQSEKRWIWFKKGCTCLPWLRWCLYDIRIWLSSCVSGHILVLSTRDHRQHNRQTS